jgi:hypothetical protein
MSKVIGEATTSGTSTQPLLVEAIQNAIQNAPGMPGTDIQHFTLLKVEFEHGGFVGSTRTRVTLDAKRGPLPQSYGKARTGRGASSSGGRSSAAGRKTSRSR